MCHATWARMLVETPTLRTFRATVVMDESHFLDTWSIVARGMMEKHFLEGRGSIYYLTATSPGTETIPGSNFAIQDVPLKMEPATAIKELMKSPGRSDSLRANQEGCQ